MIRFENISKQFSNNQHQFYALHDISLRINEGDVFGIIGPSGAGKSTLLRMINALEKPETGSVYVLDCQVNNARGSELREVRTKIGYVSQDYGLVGNHNVLEAIAEPLAIVGVPKKTRLNVAYQMLSYVGLEDKAYAYPAQLSGGQKQRVAIARALVNAPKILLCDEFTSALDDKTTFEILNFLKDIHRDLKITIVLVSHEIRVVKYLCNRVAVLEKGDLTDVIRLSPIHKEDLEDVTLSYRQQLLKVGDH